MRGVNTPTYGSNTYQHSMSFFLGPAGKGPDLLRKKGNIRWSSPELYEHVVSTNDVSAAMNMDIYGIRILSTPQEREYNEKNWSKDVDRMSDKVFLEYRKEFKAQQEKWLIDQGLSNLTMDQLVNHPVALDAMKNTERYFFEAFKDRNYNQTQYASSIPHVMLYVDNVIPIKNSRRIR